MNKMYIQPKINKYSNEDMEKFLDELDRFFDLSYDLNRLKRYNINVIGSGNLAKPYVYALAEESTRPHNVINRINWWTRSQMNKKTGTRSDEDLKEEFIHNFNHYTHDEKDEKKYTTIRKNVLIRPYREIKDLNRIVEEAEKQGSNEASLTVILNRYDAEFSFNKIYDEHDPRKIVSIERMTREQLEKKFSTDDIKLYARTLFYKDLFGYEDCLEAIIENQEIVLQMRSILEKYNPEAQDDRIKNNLINSLIGNAAVAKAFTGYNGTIINMVNPVEIMNTQFASHSGIPVNRIFSPIDNDYARFKAILKEEYFKAFNVEYEGNIHIPSILGPHNKYMNVNRDKIFFDDKTFEEIFKNQFPDKIFAEALNKLRKFGTSFYDKHGETSKDTVPSLIAATKVMLYEQNSSEMRGCVYAPDQNIFTGRDYTIQRGCIKPVFLNLEKLPAELKLELDRGTEFDRGIIKEMSTIKDIFGKYNHETAIVPDVPPDTRPNRDITDMINQIQQANGKVAKIKFRAYFRSAKSDNRRAIHEYRFDGSINPEVIGYQFILPDEDILLLDHELFNSQINNFDAEHSKLVMLAARGHQKDPTDYYINEYIDSDFKASHKIVLGVKDRIKQLILNKDIYLLVRKEQGPDKSKHDYLYTFKDTMQNLGKAPIDEFAGIVSYKNGVAGFFDKEVYQYEKEWKLLIRTDNSIADIIKMDSENKILYYLADTDNPRIKTYVAHDMENNTSRSFNAKRKGFYPFSDEQGIQIWTMNDNKIQCAEYNNKKDLFMNKTSNEIIEIDSMPLVGASIWAMQRDIMALDNSTYIDSIGRTPPGENRYFSLVIKNNKRIAAIPVGSVRQYTPAGGVLV